MEARNVDFYESTTLSMSAQEIPAVKVSDTINHGREALLDIGVGSVAGIVGKVVEYPFDTVKVRLQSQPDYKPLRYKGPLDCFRQSIRQDGFRGLYRGVSPPLLGAAVENSSLFFSYRVAQQILQATVYTGPDALSLSALAVAGAMSGAFTSLLLTPIELIKCKMQVPLEMGIQRESRPGVLSIVSSVYRTSGLAGFWRGQLGTLLRETGGSAAWFGSYEGVSAAFRAAATDHMARETQSGTDIQPMLPIWQQMIAGAFAGMAYNLAFYPADTIKSRMQTEDVSLAKGTRPTFWTVGREIWKQHGMRGLYRGCGITVARAAPSSALVFTIYATLRNALE